MPRLAEKCQKTRLRAGADRPSAAAKEDLLSVLGIDAVTQVTVEDVCFQRDLPRWQDTV